MTGFEKDGPSSYDRMKREYLRFLDAIISYLMCSNELCKYAKRNCVSKTFVHRVFIIQRILSVHNSMRTKFVDDRVTESGQSKTMSTHVSGANETHTYIGIHATYHTAGC